MKMVKNIAIVAFAASFMFAGVGFHYANNYTAMDEGTNVDTSWGVTYDLNDNTSVGWDSNLGMMMYFDAPAGVTLRLGWTASVAGTVTAGFCAGGNAVGDEDELGCAGTTGAWTPEANDNNGLVSETSVGLGYTWWTGGTGLKTSISTNYDYVMAPGATVPAVQEQNSSNLSVVVGFGF